MNTDYVWLVMLVPQNGIYKDQSAHTPSGTGVVCLGESIEDPWHGIVLFSSPLGQYIAG